MLYLIAIIFPPLALLLTGRIISAFFNIFLTLLFWLPGMLHALVVIHNDRAEKRHKQLIKAMRQVKE